MPSEAVGFVLALLAAFLNGSFLVPFKKKSVQDMHLHNFVFVFYFCTGVLLSGILVISVISINPIAVAGTGTVLVFVPFGFLGGLILVTSVTCNFTSVSLIGIALAQGIFSGVGIIVSFLWGVIVFEEKLKDASLAILGVAILVIGIFIVANCHQIEAAVAKYLLNSIDNTSLIRNPDMVVNISIDKTIESITVGNEMTAGHETKDKDKSKNSFTLGVIYAMLTGLAGGTILVPLHFVKPLEAGFVFIPSFGLGTFVGSVLLLAVVFVKNGFQLPPFHVKETAVYGIISGIIWNVNNVLTVIAIPILGFALAFPLVQLAILVGGTWGIFLFGEIKGRTIYYFYGAGILVVLGAILLSFGVG